MDLTRLLETYSNCHLCGSDKVGEINGKFHGLLSIENGIFLRECICGWKVKLDRSQYEKTPEEKLKLNLDKHINADDMWYRGYVAGAVRALECHDIRYDWLDYDYRKE